MEERREEGPLGNSGPQARPCPCQLVGEGGELLLGLTNSAKRATTTVRCTQLGAGTATSRVKVVMDEEEQDGTGDDARDAVPPDPDDSGEAHHTERTESEEEVERELEVTFHRENKAKSNNCTRLKGIPPYLAPKGGVDRW